MSLATLQRTIRDVRDEAVSRRARIATFREQAESKRKLSQEREAEAVEWQEAHVLLDLAGASARTEVKEAVESLVTQALRSVLRDPSYSFEVAFAQRRGQVELDFFVVRGGVRRDPMECMGGGILDVVAISLRLIFLELLGLPGTVVFDEPAKMVSSEHLPALGAFLREYSSRTGRQIIMVTHSDVLARSADKVIRVSHDGERSVVQCQ